MSEKSLKPAYKNQFMNSKLKAYTDLSKGEMKMSQNGYSAIRCKPLQGVPWNYESSTPSKKVHTSHASPHYHIVSEIDDGTQYTIVINIESRDPATPLLLYYIDENYSNPITSKILDTFKDGYSIETVDSAPGGIALDYVKGNLFDHTKMIKEKYLPDGEDSLNQVIDGYVQKAIQTGGDIYAFGMEFDDNGQNYGVHDIHMNQGNEDKYRSDDGVYQDGALFIYYPDENKWIAMFFAFQSQSFNTDSQGHAK